MPRLRLAFVLLGGILLLGGCKRFGPAGAQVHAFLKKEIARKPLVTQTLKDYREMEETRWPDEPVFQPVPVKEEPTYWEPSCRPGEEKDEEKKAAAGEGGSRATEADPAAPPPSAPRS